MTSEPDETNPQEQLVEQHRLQYTTSENIVTVIASMIQT